MAQKKSPDSFSASLEKLEALAARLEDDTTPLEKSLQDFESGVQLVRKAQKALLEAEQRVKLLLEQDGEPVATAFQDIEYGSDIDKQ